MELVGLPDYEEFRERYRLTNREKEVVRELVVGSSTNKAIAERLGVSERTVKIHFGNIFRKTGLKGNMVEEVQGRGKLARVTSRLAEPSHSQFSDAVNALADFGYNVTCVVCTLEQLDPPQKWLQAITNGTTPSAGNQGVFSFPNSQIYVHQGLKFRSKTEIRIFDELVSRGVLVFPLAAAVMGKPGQIF